MPRRADKFPDGVLVPNPQPVVLHDGKITAQAIQQVNDHLLTMANKVNGDISFGDGSSSTRSGNINGRWITLTTPGTPSTEFPVYHNLGRIPIAVFPAFGSDYFRLRTSSEGSWNKDVLFLQCDAGSIQLRLLVV